MVCVGIGGPGLGAQVFFQSIRSKNSPMQVLFHGESTDPTSIDDLLSQVDLNSTVFVIMSKSGTTVETMSQYLFLKSKVEALTPDWQDHFVFVTDPKQGLLKIEADQHKIKTLDFPESVGGRYSIFTSVGLLPALAMGINIEQLLSAARQTAASIACFENAQLLASYTYFMYQQGLKVNIIMPYSTRLTKLAQWYRQLVAESLGKNGTGMLLVAAQGPVDQHSQLQFYTQGSLLQWLLFLRVDDHGSDHSVQSVELEGLRYLQHQSFSHIINTEHRATALALYQAGRPSLTFELAEISVTSIAQLLITLELTVVVLAEMLGVDAFDQPGVEASKNFMYALLGRQGFEATLAEIKEIESKINS